VCLGAVTSDVAEVAVASPQRVQTLLLRRACEDQEPLHLLSLLISSHSDHIEQPHHSPTMPKQFTRKRPAGDEYEADGGFVEDAPKSKKTKAGGNAKAATSKSSAKSQDSESQYWEVCRIRSRQYRSHELIRCLARTNPPRSDQHLPRQAAG
jgi:hypothetical protein